MKSFLTIFAFFLAANCVFKYWNPLDHRPQATYSACIAACQDIKRATFMRRQCFNCCETRKERNMCIPKTTVIAFAGDKYYEDKRGPVANMYTPLYGAEHHRMAQIVK